MAISHKDHDHPNTPAARAACRKAMAKGTPVEMAVLVGKSQGGPEIKSANNTKPRTSRRNLKKPGTSLRTIGDLADVPRMLAHGARLAWDLGWDVKVGEPFNDEESNIVAFGPVARVTLVWKSANPHGVTAIWVRRNDSSVAHKVESIQGAIDAALTEDAWDGHGHIVGL